MHVRLPVYNTVYVDTVWRAIPYIFCDLQRRPSRSKSPFSLPTYVCQRADTALTSSALGHTRRPWKAYLAPLFYCPDLLSAKLLLTLKHVLSCAKSSTCFFSLSAAVGQGVPLKGIQPHLRAVDVHVDCLQQTYAYATVTCKSQNNSSFCGPVHSSPLHRHDQSPKYAPSFPVFGIVVPNDVSYCSRVTIHARIVAVGAIGLEHRSKPL